MLVSYIFLVQVIEIGYAINDLSPPAALALLQPFGFLGLICWWLQRDSLRTRTSWPLDVGMYLYVAWWVILPYHMLTTRGSRAVIDIILFVVVVVTLWMLVSMAAFSLTA